MKLEDVLLTNTEEGNIEISSGLTEYQQNTERYKAQCLKLLDVLKKEGCIDHVSIWLWVECLDCKNGITHVHSHSHSGHYAHASESCWLCVLEKLLKEG